MVASYPHGERSDYRRLCVAYYPGHPRLHGRTLDQLVIHGLFGISDPFPKFLPCFFIQRRYILALQPVIPSGNLT
jgi:hypothetical protein